MPDKNHKKGCGNDCMRCWRNKLKHANPEAKRFLKKQVLNSQQCLEQDQQYDTTLSYQNLFANKFKVAREDDFVESETEDDQEGENTVNNPDSKGEIRTVSLETLNELRKERLIV